MTEDLTTAAARLAEVLAAENAALAALDLPRAGAMLAVKTRAADAFVAAHALSPGGSAGVSAGVPPGLSAGLSVGLSAGLSAGLSGGASLGADPASSERLRALLAENQRLLAIAITVQSRVIGIIASALPRAMQGAAPRYGGGGRTLAPALRAIAISARA